MSEVVVERRRGSRGRRFRLFVLAGALALLVIYVGFDLWAGRRVRLLTERLEQRYGTLAEDSLRLAPVPAEENRARLVRAAAALGVRPSNAVREFITAVGKSQATPPIPPEILQFIESNREALRIAGTFTSRERASWEVEPDGTNMPDLLEIRMLSNALFLSALAELAGGRPDEASKAIGAGLALSASLRQENQLISQLIRIAIAAHQLDATQRMLAESEPSAAALSELALRLSENRAPDPIRLGLVAEMKTIHGFFSRLERGRIDSIIGRPSLFRGVFYRLARPFVRMTHASSLETTEGLLAVQTGPRPRGPFPEPGRSMVFSAFDFGSNAGLARAIETGDDFMSIQNLAEVAVALRRYRIDRGSYPDDLAVLAPAYLSTLPMDPFTGRPPAYARQGSGFTVKSERDSAPRPYARQAAWVVGK